MAGNVESPQGPPTPGDEVEDFLQNAPIARLGSHNDDGTIHLVPVWFKFDRKEFLINTSSFSRKARNIEQDGRVIVLVDTQEIPYKGAVI